MEEKDYEEKNDERSDGSSSDSGIFRRLWRKGNVRQPRASGAKAEETTAQGSKETKEEKTGGAGENTEAGNADGGEYTVAVVKQMDHASLDEIAAAVCEELDAWQKRTEFPSSMRYIPARATSRC